MFGARSFMLCCFFVTIQPKKSASGGKVCHLESRLQMRSPPMSRRSPLTLIEWGHIDMGVDGFLGENHIRL